LHTLERFINSNWKQYDYYSKDNAIKKTQTFPTYRHYNTAIFAPFIKILQMQNIKVKHKFMMMKMQKTTKLLNMTNRKLFGILALVNDET
jgi:hypothetical protein